MRRVFKEFFRRNGYRLGGTGRITRKTMSEEPKSDNGEEKAGGAPLKF
jgi:hypothetical protein